MQRQCILDSGGMRGLEHLLQAREGPRQEAAVEALAALTVGNADALDTIVASRESCCIPAPYHAAYICLILGAAPVFCRSGDGDQTELCRSSEWSNSRILFATKPIICLVVDSVWAQQANGSCGTAQPMPSHAS